MPSEKASSKTSCFAGLIKMHKSSFNSTKEEPPSPLLDLECEAKPAWKMLGARKMHRELLSLASSEGEGSCRSSRSNTSSSNSFKSQASSEEIRTAVLSNRLAWNLLAHRRKQRMQLSASHEEKKIQDTNTSKLSSQEAAELIRGFPAENADLEESCEALFIHKNDLNVCA
mmetsp:Transcript_41789/g.85431  ORF Transcript_41789/g.85431 Transcript_41789/m.85431 type:complete len:171 (+) Transcript_41789:38-550(+)